MEVRGGREGGQGRGRGTGGQDRRRSRWRSMGSMVPPIPSCQGLVSHPQLFRDIPDPQMGLRLSVNIFWSGRLGIGGLRRCRNARDWNAQCNAPISSYAGMQVSNGISELFAYQPLIYPYHTIKMNIYFTFLQI